MQDRYVGDVGDFGKYGLLRSLCRGDEHGAALRLGGGTASTETTRPPLTMGVIPTTSMHRPVKSGRCANATPTSSSKCSIS